MFLKVEELQKRLMGMEEEASAARSAATESLRLTDENALLGNQLKQMEFNLKVNQATHVTINLWVNKICTTTLSHL